MASSLDQIEQFIANQDLRYRRNEEDEYIQLGFTTENYIDQDGDHNLLIIIRLEEDGSFLKVFTPSCYQYSGLNKGILFQVLLMVSWKTKMIQFEYDHNDGEVRAVIEYPLEDAELTERQLMRSVVSLAQIIDKYNSAIVHAIENGEIQFDDDSQSEMMQLLRQIFEAQNSPEAAQNVDEDDDDSDDMEFI